MCFLPIHPTRCPVCRYLFREVLLHWVPEVGKQGFVSFGRRSPDETVGAIGSLIEMGFAPVEIIPDFNEYVGAQVLGGVSQMIRLISTGKPQPLVTGTYHGALYTADLKRRR